MESFPRAAVKKHTKRTPLWALIEPQGNFPRSPRSFSDEVVGGSSRKFNGTHLIPSHRQRLQPGARRKRLILRGGIMRTKGLTLTSPSCRHADVLYAKTTLAPGNPIRSGFSISRSGCCTSTSTSTRNPGQGQEHTHMPTPNQEGSTKIKKKKKVEKLKKPRSTWHPEPILGISWLQGWDVKKSTVNERLRRVGSGVPNLLHR